MFTTGAKWYFGFAGGMLLAAWLFGIFSGDTDNIVGSISGVVSLGYKGGVGDHLGYTIFVMGAAASFAMGVLAVMYRDGDAETAVAEAGEESLMAVPAQGESWWPIVGAFGLGITIVGLVFTPWLFIAGLFVLAIAAIEWTVQDWSERATGDAEVNRINRDRLMRPFEIPAAAAVTTALVVLSVSRVLLSSSRWGAVIIAGIASAVILLVAWLVAASEKPSRNLVAGVILLGGVATIALGIVGLALGERDFDHPAGAEHEDEAEGDALPAHPAVASAVLGG
ncbi:MAG: hypothetical protein GY929_05600 [Actinomycetia bacterium]|nr:hypothetical protein [Actinomycetes bacterium]